MPPSKPGEARNPQGINQYTKTRDLFDRLLDELGGDQKSRREAILAKVIELAEKGKPYALDQVLKRVLPTVEKHEHLVTPAPRSHEFVPDEADQAALRREIKGNGKALQ